MQCDGEMMCGLSVQWMMVLESSVAAAGKHRMVTHSSIRCHFYQASSFIHSSTLTSLLWVGCTSFVALCVCMCS